MSQKGDIFMKKVGLIKLLVGLTLAASGAFAVGSAVSHKKAESVEAATPSSYTNVYRFSVPNTFGSDVGNHIYLHAWGSNGGDTTWGNFLTLSDYSYNENSERMYTLATNYTYTGFIIIRYSDNPDYCKTANINVGSDTAWSWNGNSGASASAWTPTNQTYYLYDYTNKYGGNAKCYAWQSNGSLNNGTYPGVSMTKVQYGSGHLYSISLDPAFDEAKFGIGDSANTGDVWINQNRGHCYCEWAENPDWSSDLDWVKAHDWALQTMHLRDIPTTNNSDTGACRGSSGYYSKAKTAYQNFNTAVKTKINSLSEASNAKARFSAWALANGETATFNGTTLTISNARTSLLPTTTNLENTNMVAIIVIISLVSVTAISGFFFISKRKEN